MSVERVRCWLCSGPPEDYPRDEHGGARFELTQDVLCDRHWQKEEAERLQRAAHEAFYHVEGAPTPECGCVMFADTAALQAWLLDGDE